MPGETRDHFPDGLLVRAAARALETGDARHIVIWVPEESANTVTNLLEKVCCERRQNPHAPVTDWYFRTVGGLAAGSSRYGSICLSGNTPEERRAIQLVDRACGEGDVRGIIREVPDTPEGHIRGQFLRVMEKKDFPVRDTAAGRDYVAAYSDLVALVLHRHGSR